MLLSVLYMRKETFLSPSFPFPRFLLHPSSRSRRRYRVASEGRSAAPR